MAGNDREPGSMARDVAIVVHGGGPLSESPRLHALGPPHRAPLPSLLFFASYLFYTFLTFSFTTKRLTKGHVYFSPSPLFFSVAFSNLFLFPLSVFGVCVLPFSVIRFFFCVNKGAPRRCWFSYLVIYNPFQFLPSLSYL